MVVGDDFFGYSDDATYESPGLEPFNPQLTPPPEKPAFLPNSALWQQLNAPRYSARHHGSRIEAPKAPQSLEDRVLLSYLGPNSPEVSGFAGERTLLLSSDEGSDDGMDVEMSVSSGAAGDDKGTAHSKMPTPQPIAVSAVESRARSASIPLEYGDKMDTQLPPLRSTGISAGVGRRHAAELDIRTRALGGQDLGRRRLPNFERHSVIRGRASMADMRRVVDQRPLSPPPTAREPKPPSMLNSVIAGATNTSSPLRRHTISHGRGPPEVLPPLPPLQAPLSPQIRNLAGSPSAKQHNLPGFQHLSQLAEAGNQEQEAQRSAGSFHRASFSSTSGPNSQVSSPTIDRRSKPPLPGSQPPPSMTGSPPTRFPPLLQTSPLTTGAHNDSSPSDPYLKNLPPSATSTNSGAASATTPASGILTNHPFFRRASQASDCPPTSAGPRGLTFLGGLPTPASATTSTPLSSNQSENGFTSPISTSPQSSQQDKRMSIDGVGPALPAPRLPLPQGMTPHTAAMSAGLGGPVGIPPAGMGIAPSGSGFQCDHPGCTAPPFQTQYLLNSHANVHSSVRPHYCPVPGCPRGEGGKGFKRKNEMIRHGLVHDSPGYVCPFCPDREHKYPRPDNLQRHVRVHHVDKDKDDPALRDVLAQRPEGGNRGRRKRIGGLGPG